MFTSPESFLHLIEDKRNIYFCPYHLNTEHNPLIGDEAVIEKADAIPFLISGKEEFSAGKSLQVAAIVAEVLGVDIDALGVLAFGSGCAIFVMPEKPLGGGDVFDQMNAYKVVMERIKTSVRAQGIFIDVENMWKKGALVPMPDAQLESGYCSVAWSDIRPVDFDLWAVADLKVDEGETLPPETLQAFPKPDTDTVLEECAFLRERARSEDLTWKEKGAALSVLSHVAGKGTNSSLDLAHEFARNWKGYDNVKIAGDISKALAFGPSTCITVNAACGKHSVCPTCPHWGHVTSPVMIQSSDFVATESTGFHKIQTNERGVVRKIPDYEGLRRHFYKQAPYVTISDSEATFTWNGKIWNPVFDLTIKGFAQKHFKPMADSKMASEFLNIVKRTELRLQSWFNESTEGKMNFQNGVLDIKTMQFEKHSIKYGFRSVLPYDYDPEATCPRFEQFLREVTLDRQELIDIILEFAGYSLSGDKCWEQKAIVLLGEGQNGKSKLVSVIKALAGEGASTSQTFVDLEKDTNRASLDGSLFNIAEETPSKSLMDSSLFKALIGGAEVSVKRLYQQPYEIRNRAKFWMLCNEMPRTADKAHALLRRLCIVPFDAMFTGDKDDKRIEEKLMVELPGILNLVLASYKKMLERGGLPPSEIALQKLHEYREENDNVYRWFTECVQDLGPDSEYWTTPQELFFSYQKYANDQGEKPATGPSFFKRLALIWKPYHQRKYSKRIPPHMTPEKAVRGIKIDRSYRKPPITVVKNMDDT